MRCLAALLVSLLVCPLVLRAAPVSQATAENKKCLECHGQTKLPTMSVDDRRKMLAPTTQALSPDARPGLFVRGDAFDNTVHAGLKCVDCHKSAAGQLPHSAELPPPDCNGTCHAAQSSDMLQGAHAAAAAKDPTSAPTCITCHGGHDILPKTNRESKTYPLNIAKTCGDCHAKHTNDSNGEYKNGKERVDGYLSSVHGRAVEQSGLIVAATCADCHGSHRVAPSTQPTSLTSRGNIVATCGKCHVGIEESLRASAHGLAAKDGNTKAPVCSDCHTSHSISRTETPAFKLDIVNECGTCHDETGPAATRKSSLYDTYRRSYHGQVNALGSSRGARCSDCHGAHTVSRINDPKSPLAAANRAETCRKCHPQSNASFAKFEAHADHRDSKRYPLLHGIWWYFVIMMSFAFGFFGLHSVLWFVRSAIERIRQGPAKKFVANGQAIQRFNRVDRINHAFVIISFFGLTLTGLPLLYADKAWAKSLMTALGGVWMAGILHRFFAIILILNFVVHFFGLINRVRKYGLKNLLFGPATMLPRKKDFADCAGMWKWFFVGGKKPAFDRWTYWEKFDYVAEVGGSLIIGVTGLMLWFPETFSKVMPGWMFNVATLIHGYEALLAIGFIFTIHFFNAHLRLEKFPVDDVMFTGSLPEEELKHERGAEYERLVATGEIDKLRVPTPPAKYRRFAVAAGMLAMAIGTTLVVLIVLAGIGVI